ncbi:MAG: TetR/AcrR family transcriptional regulator [Clostridia bacterium]|nr:TetR/AcrR family transcriptional regulator [Clostridia bacterium]
MNTFNNKRKRDSIEKIKNALLNLLRTNEIEDITVTMICQEAKINRSTFYANYENMQELIKDLGSYVQETVKELYQFDKEDQAHGLINVGKLLKYIYKNPKIYSTFYKLGYDKLCCVTKEDLKNEIVLKLYEGKYIEYHVLFFTAGFNAVIKRWMDTGLKETPEEIEKIILSEYKDQFEKLFKTGEEKS